MEKNNVLCYGIVFYAAPRHSATPGERYPNLTIQGTMRALVQCSLRSPVNGILGKDTCVRVLRALTRTDQPLKAAELVGNAQRQIFGIHG